MLPDTQCYSLFYPGIFHSQGRFAARLAERSSVFHLVHVGDITDLNSHAEWEVARSALGPVTDIISPTLVTGNHDLGPAGSAADRTTLLDEYFSNLHFESTFDESIQNSASLVGDDWLVVGLEFAPRPEVLDWANAVIAGHPDRFVLIATHAYLFEEGRRYDSASQPYHPSDYVVGDEGADGAELWSSLVRLHANVRIVVGGHVPGTYAVSSARGDSGNLVWEIVIDFQEVPCRPEGSDGQGFLLVLERMEPGRMTAMVHSPWRDDTIEEMHLELEPL